MDVNNLLLALCSQFLLLNWPCWSNSSSRIIAGGCRHIPCGILDWLPRARAQMAESIWAACDTGAATMLGHSCQHLQEKAEPREAVELWSVSVAGRVVHWYYYRGSNWEMRDCGQDLYLHWIRVQCNRKQDVLRELHKIKSKWYVSAMKNGL